MHQIQDPHQSDTLDPEPDSDPHQFADEKPNIWNTSLFKHFFKSLSLKAKFVDQKPHEDCSVSNGQRLVFAFSTERKVRDI